MMLLAADGESNTQIAHTVGVSRPTVTLWRSRYEQAGVAGLVDEHRSGRPRSVDHAKVVAATLALAAEEVRGHALEQSIAREPCGYRQHHGGRDVA